MKKILTSFLFSISIFLVIFSAIELEQYWISNEKIGIRIFSPIERLLLDLRFFYREENFNNREQIQEHINNSPFVSKEALLVGIDQESLVEMGEWPWYRHVYKDFIKKVEHFSPLSIHLDIIFNIGEEIPKYIANKISLQTPANLPTFRELYSEMDGVFIDELKKHNNIYVDQFLLKNRLLRFEPDFIKKLNANEEILKNNAVPFQFPEKYSPPYVFTEPLIPGVMENAIPAVVNAEADSDKILRKAVLLYPYQTQKNENLLLSSIYLMLILKYFNISKKNIEILDDRLVLKNAMVPHLEVGSKNPIIEEWELPQLSSALTDRNIQVGNYNQNLYNFIINVFKVRFQEDTIKMPDFAIQVLDNEDGTYTIIRGKEVYDAAMELKSKVVKVMVKTRKNLEIPIFGNQDGNPFTTYINFGGKQFIQGSQNGVNFSEFTIPKKSFKDVYTAPYLPEIPPLIGSASQANVINSLVSREDVRKWFQELLDLRIKTMQKAVFDLYRNVSPSYMMKYAVQDNHYEGFIYLIDQFLKQKGWDLSQNAYQKFVINIFKRNKISLDHPLVTDFIFSENAVYDFLIDTYGEGFRNYYDKSIFVGALTTGMALDVHKTTYGDMFGITTIVNAFNTVIKDNQLRQVNYSKEIISLLIFCLVVGLAYTFLPLLLKYLFIFLCTIAIFIVSLAFFNEGYILYTFPFLVANLLTFPVIILYSILVEQRDKRFLQLSFSDYLSPELIDEMYKKKERPQLGGEEKIISAYFTDIASFSSFSELLTPSQLVELLNEYLGKMTDILMTERGTLDKYEGDAIIAFFGAPSHLGDESLRACKTAIKMQKELVALTEKWKGEKSPTNLNQKDVPIEKWDPAYKWPFLVHGMKMRIGINTGSVVVGNMGSEKRKNYTMMGDSVNLAARLESLAKQYGIYTIISENVATSINENDPDGRPTKDFIFDRLLDKVTVVGKEEPIKIYELFCLAGEETDNLKLLKESYEAGMDHYFKMEWKEAIQCFSKSRNLETNQTINPSMIMVERCQSYIKNPPAQKGEEWDGVFRQTQK